LHSHPMKTRPRPPKVIGEWVELRFMSRAADKGLTISKPYGDSAPFDFVVGRRKLHRVQVRGTSIYTRRRAYVVHLLRGRPAVRFSRRDFDFLAVYIIPLEAWYLIPVGSLPRRRSGLQLFPHIPVSSSRFEKFRDAWHLLR